jgi:MscS family membrane protein
VEASGSSLAFPSRTIYVSRDTGLDSKKGQEAIEIVKGWREQGELPFPNFAPERIAEMKNKLEYPSTESAMRKGRQTDRKDY